MLLYLNYALKNVQKKTMCMLIPIAFGDHSRKCLNDVKTGMRQAQKRTSA